MCTLWNKKKLLNCGFVTDCLQSNIKGIAVKALNALTLVFFSTVALNTLAADLVTATGFGTVDMDKAVNKAQARMMAKRAAMLDAQRQLSETVRGVQLTGGTTVEEYEVTSDLVATRVKNILQGAFVINSNIESESRSFAAEVTLGVCVDEEPTECKGKMTLESIVRTATE